MCLPYTGGDGYGGSRLTGDEAQDSFADRVRNQPHGASQISGKLEWVIRPSNRSEQQGILVAVTLDWVENISNRKI